MSSIKALALELYRAQQNVSKLEIQLEGTSSNDEKQIIEEKLREAQAELKLLRRILDGEKTPSPYRTFPSSFNTKR